MIEAGKYHDITPLGRRFRESLSEVLDAIRRQDGESAARIMLAHITDFNVDIMDR
jgi:DNA-binding GntR family transcriptional regulator